jgi:hypothetical protein
MPGGEGLTAAEQRRRPPPAGPESGGVVCQVIASGAVTYLREGLPRGELALIWWTPSAPHGRRPLHQ